MSYVVKRRAQYHSRSSFTLTQLSLRCVPSHPLPLSVSPSSPCGKKFRSKPQIAKFLGENHTMDLSCFDFSRGAYGEITQRRRARDRHISKKMESVKPMTVIKPLSVNPLRASGPIRRTCGVIKLPVTWVAPPDDEQNFNPLTAGEQRSQIHNIVQSLWQNRLYGVKPYDHLTGDEIADDSKVEVKPITPMVSKPHSPRTLSPVPPLSHSPTSTAVGNGAGGNVPIKPAPSIVPQLYRHHPIGGGNTSPLLPALLKTVTQDKVQDQAPPPATPNFAVIQQTGQPIIVPPYHHQTHHSPPPHRLLPPPPTTLQHHRYTSSPSAQFSNGMTLSPSTKPPVAPVALMVTDRDLQLQEERVRHLRKQLLAAVVQHSST